MLSKSQVAKVALLFLIIGSASFGYGKNLQHSSSQKMAVKKTASRKTQKISCPENIARTSIYYTPDVKTFCGSTKRCRNFNDEVEVQGSGRLANGKIITSTGKVKDIGDCEFAVGYFGTCLRPYISIAADVLNKMYQMEDIIYIEELRGLKYLNENSEWVTHKGYLMVEDIGGKIKGGRRFDLYVGKTTQLSEDFKSLKIADKIDCSARKQFKIIRKDSPGYYDALAEIKNQTQTFGEGHSTSSGSINFSARR